MKLRFNHLCLIGVAIGVFSLFGPWATYAYPDYYWMSYKMPYYPDLLAPMIFIVGLLLALVTPLGGILQIVSIADCLINYQSGLLYFHHVLVTEYGYQFTLFFFIAVVSSMIVLFSIRSPTWMSRDDGSFPRPRDKVNPLSRLLTFSSES